MTLYLLADWKMSRPRQMKKPRTIMLCWKQMTQMQVNDPHFSNTPIQGGLVENAAERILTKRAMLRNEVTAMGIHMTT